MNRIVQRVGASAGLLCLSGAASAQQPYTDTSMTSCNPGFTVYSSRYDMPVCDVNNLAATLMAAQSTMQTAIQNAQASIAANALATDVVALTNLVKTLTETAGRLEGKIKASEEQLARLQKQLDAQKKP